MDKAEEVSLAILEDAATLETIYEGIPAEAKLPAFLESVQAMKQTSKDGTLLRTYAFDAFGNRTIKAENGRSTYYHYDAYTPEEKACWYMIIEILKK